MTKQEIKKWLSRNRKWSAWEKWTHQQGDPISKRTLRRGLDEREPKPRQEKAIDLAKVYISAQTPPVFQAATA